MYKRQREFLYSDGYTIKGVQRLLKDGLIKSTPNQIDTELDMVPVTQDVRTENFSKKNKNDVEEIIEELQDLKRLLSEL